MNARSPEIAMVAALAASGDTASMQRHAKYALDAGATKLEFKKMLYLTAVYAGAPKGIEATRALADLLTEQANPCSHRSARIDDQHS
jgi:4-carboxymuconolactone decarboxylase